MLSSTYRFSSIFSPILDALGSISQSSRLVELSSSPTSNPRQEFPLHAHPGPTAGCLLSKNSSGELYIPEA